jgi:uncharacterized protein (TIGR02466 family)
MKQLIILWPNSIGIFEYPDHESLNKKLLECEELRASAWLAKNNVWDLKDKYPFLKDLHDWILQCSAEYAEKLFDIEYQPDFFEHTHGWINYRSNGEEVVLHNHRLTAITATYYVDVYDTSGDIRFIDPRSTLGWISLNMGEAYNRYTHKPERGQLILFPGWLLHQVLQNKTDRERVALSTNINLSSKFKYNVF